MLKVYGKFVPKGVLTLFFLTFFLIGGCDIEFGGGGDDNGGGGGGGGGVNEIETVQGTIIDIIPDQEIEGITVEATVNSTAPETTLTDDTGFFSIEGPIAGNVQLQFEDPDGLFLGQLFTDVYPTAEIELGEMTLDNGNVILDDPNPDITFQAEITENNCTGNNSGSLEVEAKNDQGERQIIVQISASTDLIIDGDDVNCSDLRLGRTAEIQGEIISSSTVDATRVEIE